MFKLLKIMVNKYNKVKNQNSGVTLIELIITLAIMGIVISASASVLLFGMKVLKLSEEEYDFQFATRQVLENTTSIVRYSTAIFTVPESSFNSGVRSKGWDYIGLREVELSPASGVDPAVVGTEIVRYTYDSVTDTHKENIILAAKKDINYNFIFKKINPHEEDSLIEFTIESYPAGSLDASGNPIVQLEITSEVEAKNSLQVIDLSTASDAAVAIAFRLEDRSKNVVGHVAMVLDKSGSMSNDLSSGSGSKISILRSKAIELVNTFAVEDNIDISLVPFATTANNPGDFYSAKNETTTLTTAISGLNALGGTNTGDGLRRAYYGLKTHNDTLIGTGAIASNYLIVLVDGVTTFYSVKSSTDTSFVLDNSSINNDNRVSSGGQIGGNGGSLDPTGKVYVDTIGANFKTNNFAKVYVIGFSRNNSELLSVKDIASACGAKTENVFKADSATALTAVFSAIQQDIVNDLWYLQGPDL